jgi:hypothetical protein
MHSSGCPWACTALVELLLVENLVVFIVRGTFWILPTFIDFMTFLLTVATSNDILAAVSVVNPTLNDSQH